MTDAPAPDGLKTLADHSRAYRQRKAAKLERMEAALREIMDCRYADHDYMRDIARQALANDVKS